MHPAIEAKLFADCVSVSTSAMCLPEQLLLQLVFQFVVADKILQLVGPDKLFATSLSRFIAFANCCWYKQLIQYVDLTNCVEKFWKTASNVALSRHDL